MSAKSRNRQGTPEKRATWTRRKRRVRGKVYGTSERPRLSVFKSNSHLYAQVIDDAKSVTLASASTLDPDVRGKAGCNLEGAKTVGDLVAKRAMAKQVASVVFDRNGYLYHGKVKALADAAREGGLKF